MGTYQLQGRKLIWECVGHAQRGRYARCWGGATTVNIVGVCRALLSGCCCRRLCSRGFFFVRDGYTELLSSFVVVVVVAAAAAAAAAVVVVVVVLRSYLCRLR